MQRFAPPPLHIRTVEGPCRCAALTAGDETALLWTQDGISGAVIVADPNRFDSAEIFLEQFLAS